jgi:hypothetical protein
MNDSTCRWPECERPAASLGLCSRDYMRARSVGDTVSPWVEWKNRPKRGPVPKSVPCRWPGCDRASRTRHFCQRDYRRAKSVNDYESPWSKWTPPGSHVEVEVCRWPRCTREPQQQGYCWRDLDRHRKRIDPEPMRKRVRERHRRRRAWKMGRAFEHFTDLQVRMTHGDVCYLCGDKINFRLKHPNPKSPSLDHVLALSRGGTHTLGNVAMTHLNCNVRKNASPTTSVPQPTIFAL